MDNRISISNRNNNLDILRFFAAVLVIFSHSFPLFLGNDMKEPLMIISRGKMSLGGFAVGIFFLISGFLIFMSFDRSKSIMSYLKKRILRIFPGLIVSVVVTIIVIGIWVSDLSLIDYFSRIDTYKYLINISLIFSSGSTLNGAFSSNVYANVVNGSLWTLKFEFLLYLFIVVLSWLKFLTPKGIKYTMICFFVTNAFLVILQELINPNFPLQDTILNFVNLGQYFLVGMFFYIYRGKITFTTKRVFISSLLLIFGMLSGYPSIFLAIFGGYLIFYIGFILPHYSGVITKHGDFSYGLYIYAFPIQQMVYYFLKDKLTFFENFMFVFILTFSVSILSWFFVEKPALKFK